MIKGISRQIIEVNNTESIYFDKAVFYLKPGVRILPDEISSREIEGYLEKNNIHHPACNKFRRGKIVSALTFIRNIIQRIRL
ncbi:MAG: hypothetical protein NC093_09510 [Alistipes sp.]|nr:hypothetical protein [Alistipes sp.]